MPENGPPSGLLPLPVVDACTLDEKRRTLLRPNQTFADRQGGVHRLPRWFYRVDSWQTALGLQVTEHFALAELMTLDVREAQALRVFPRYVPCAITLLAAHLEVFRQAVGTLVYVAANGGYRSPAHALTDHASTHCWGTAANIYRIGDDFLDSQERIERYAKLVARVLPAVWTRPYGVAKGLADDHLHLDIGYARLTPAGLDDEPNA
jgi:hypothetical protein